MKQAPIALRAAAVLELRRRGYRRPVRDIEELLTKYLTDPWAYFLDKLGIRLTPQMSDVLGDLLVHPRMAVPAANGVGKTNFAASYALWFFDVRGALPDPQGHFPERGARVLLMAPTHATAFQGVYSEMLLGIERARALGHLIPGRWSQKSAAAVVRAAYNVEAFAPQRSNKEVSHSASGRHQIEQLLVADEGMGIPEPTIRAGEGMCSTDGNQILILANPTEHASAVTLGFVQRATDPNSGYKVRHISALQHPNIAERRPVVQAAIGFKEIDRRVRAQCQDLGPHAVPDRNKGDFRYALPPRDADGRPAPERGPREDGIPGHPDGEVRTYRPSGVFAGQTLGIFPPGSNTSLFTLAAWSAAVQRWKERHAGGPAQEGWLPVPPGSPDRVGLDAAEDGVDQIVAAPCWGEAVDELLTEYESLMAAFNERGLEAMRKSRRIFCGELHETPKGEGLHTMGNLLALYGRVPYLIDSQGGGSKLRDAAVLLKLDSHAVVFGAAAPPQIPGELLCLNLRTALSVRAAMLVEAGLADLPPDPQLQKEAFAHRLEWTTRSVEDPATGTKVVQNAVKLISKDEVKKVIGHSPDRYDAWVMSLWTVQDLVPVGARIVSSRGNRRRRR